MNLPPLFRESAFADGNDVSETVSFSARTLPLDRVASIAAILVASGRTPDDAASTAIHILDASARAIVADRELREEMSGKLERGGQAMVEFLNEAAPFVSKPEPFWLDLADRQFEYRELAKYATRQKRFDRADEMFKRFVRKTSALNGSKSSVEMQRWQRESFGYEVLIGMRKTIDGFKQQEVSVRQSVRGKKGGRPSRK